MGIAVPRRGSGAPASRWIQRNVALPMLLIAAGLAVALGFSATVLLSAALIFGVVASVPARHIAALLVLCTSLTRPAIELAGFNFRLEHLFLFALIGRIAIEKPSVLAYRVTGLEGIAALFVAWNAITSLLWAPDVASSLAIVGWMGLDVAILFVLGHALASGLVSWRLLLTAAITGAALHGLVAFALWVAGIAFGTAVGVQEEHFTGGLSAYGLAYEANMLGIQEMVWLVVLASTVLSSSMRARAPIWLGLTLGLVASLTRAAWLGLLGFGMVAVVIGGRRGGGLASRGRVASSLAAAALLGGFVLIATGDYVGPLVSQKGAALVDLQSSTGAARVETWELAIGDLQNEPRAIVFGLGTNSFGQRHLDPTNIQEVGYLGNLPLVILYDTGLVGAAIALLFCIKFIRRSRFRGWTSFGFLVAIGIAGTATNPVWFGFIWVAFVLLADDSQSRSRADSPSHTADRAERSSGF